MDDPTIVATPSKVLEFIDKHSGRLSLLVGVLAILGLLLTYYLGTRGPELTGAIISRSSILRSYGQEEQLKITFGDIPVEYLELIRLNLVCTGHRAIRREDFETPIRIIASKRYPFLAARVVQTSPEDLPVHVEMDSTGLLIDPLLLNPQDGVVIEAITTHKDLELSVRGRIVGVGRIHLWGPESPVEEIRPSAVSWAILLTMSIAFSLCIISVVSIQSIVRDRKTLTYTSLVLNHFGVCMLIFGIGFVAFFITLSFAEALRLRFLPLFAMLLPMAVSLPGMLFATSVSKKYGYLVRNQVQKIFPLANKNKSTQGDVSTEPLPE